MKRHYSEFEPTLQRLKHKYETAMKEKMLARLERDRVLGQAATAQGVRPAQPAPPSQEKGRQIEATGPRALVDAIKRNEANLDMRNQQGDYKTYPKVCHELPQAVASRTCDIERRILLMCCCLAWESAGIQMSSYIF